MEDAKANRIHKASAFTLLFSNKKNLVEIYNAINRTSYPENTEIEIITLSDALFLEQLNDIAFVIDGKLVVLIEHQSTINENMPLRMLLYMSREYEKVTNSRDLYKERRIKIPTPEFIVLYNGKKEFPDFKEMRLSDSFEMKKDACNLELVVKIYNINKGRNAEIANRSPTLSGYGEFVAEINENLKTMSLSVAIKSAVRTCIRNNILLSFLKDNGSEVENMLLSEWNMKDALEVAREEALGEGVAIGREEGEARGVAIGEARGREEERSYMKSLLKKGLSSEELLKRIEG
jgi:predicted transposase/invertase (TIGR01784 family)